MKTTTKETNADRIRKMSDDELADLLYDMADNWSCPPSIVGPCAEAAAIGGCRSCYMHWLQEEAE